MGSTKSNYLDDVFSRLDTINECDDGQSALCIASRGKKCISETQQNHTSLHTATTSLHMTQQTYV